MKEIWGWGGGVQAKKGKRVSQRVIFSHNFVRKLWL